MKHRDFIQLLIEEDKKDRALKLVWRKKLKGLINTTDLFNWLDEHNYWTPIDIVEIYNTDEKKWGYNTYQHVRIKDDKDYLLYMIQPYEDEIRGINHYCVWQITGMSGDEYSGYLLFPLKNGKYFKVSYAC